MAELVRQYLGNYRLSYLLGYGGFAEVYLGEHITLKTPAAIKVLRMQLIREAQERFLHEAHIIASLDHPNIVHVLEFGVDHHIPYLVMSYAPHGTLRQRYPRGTILPATNILPYLSQAAAPLQYAHDRNIIHRDIKPENLLLDVDDHVLLSDFGLAIASPSTRHLGFQATAGTTAYMAPEQLQGQVCSASDQYALAVVVYEWLTGGWPFNGSDQEIALQHIQCPPPLAEKVPDLPAAIEEVVLKALAKNPSERFPTIQDFADAFEAACTLELDTGAIPTVTQIFPVVAGTPTLEQTDTPDTLVLLPETYLVQDASSLFMPDLIDTSTYVLDTPTVVTDPSLISALLPISDNAVDALPCPATSESIDESPVFSNCEDDFLEDVHLGRHTSDPYTLPSTPFPAALERQKTPKRLKRRSILVGLAGIAAVGITGIGISTLVSVPKRQTSFRPSQQQVAGASNPVSDPDTISLQKPPVQDKTSTVSPAPGSTPVSNPTAPAAPTDQPGSKNRQTLTVQITNPPVRVQNNSQVDIQVSTNEPGATVLLHVIYNVPSFKDVTMQKVTDSSGHTDFPWQVQLSSTLSSTITATLAVSASDQNGQKAVAAPLMVAVGK